MPSDLITVDAVFESPTKLPGVMRYDINAHLATAALGLAYETTNPWIASLCRELAKTGTILQIVWKDSRYGRQILAAEKA